MSRRKEIKNTCNHFWDRDLTTGQVFCLYCHKEIDKFFATEKEYVEWCVEKGQLEHEDYVRWLESTEPIIAVGDKLLQKQAQNIRNVRHVLDRRADMFLALAAKVNEVIESNNEHELRISELELRDDLDHGGFAEISEENEVLLADLENAKVEVEWLKDTIHELGIDKTILHEKIDTLKEENARLESENEALAYNLDNSQNITDWKHSIIVDLRNELEEYKDDLIEANVRITVQGSENAELLQVIDGKDHEIENLEEKLEEWMDKAKFAQQVRFELANTNAKLKNENEALAAAVSAYQANA